MGKEINVRNKLRTLAAGMLILLGLGGCTDPELRRQLQSVADANQLSVYLVNQNEPRAVAWLAGNRHGLNAALFAATLQNRLNLLDAALAQGVDVNRETDCVLALQITESLSFRNTESLGHQRRALGAFEAGLAGSGIENCANFTGSILAKEHPRSVPALERLIAAGAVYDQRTLDRALTSVVLGSRDTDLADRLAAMGATVDQPPHAASRMPLFFEAVALGRVEMVAWLLRQGVDPNKRASFLANMSGSNGFFHERTPAQAIDFTALHVLSGLIYGPQLSRDFLSYADRRNAEYTEYQTRAARTAQLLIDAGAGVNAPATLRIDEITATGTNISDRSRHHTWRIAVAGPSTTTGLTPLHLAMFHRGSLFMDNHPTLTRENRELIATLARNGADQMALDSAGHTPASTADRQLAMRQQTLAAGRQNLARLRQAEARSSAASANTLGQIMASAGMLAVTGAAVGAGMNPMAAAQIGGGGVLDILTNGQAGGLNRATENLRQNRPSQPPVSTPLPAAGAGFQTESYALTCPSGASNTIPLRFRTQQCRTAMIDFARTYACNNYTRFEQVHAACQSACGSRNCEQQ